MAQITPSMPNEILDRILSFSFTEELLQARLASRECYAISTANLFKYEHFDVNAKNAEKFRDILATKHWADSVRQLTVIGPRVRLPTSSEFTSRFDILKPRSHKRT